MSNLNQLPRSQHDHDAAEFPQPVDRSLYGIPQTDEHAYPAGAAYFLSQSRAPSAGQSSDHTLQNDLGPASLGILLSSATIDSFTMLQPTSTNFGPPVSEFDDPWTEAQSVANFPAFTPEMLDRPYRDGHSSSPRTLLQSSSEANSTGYLTPSPFHIYDTTPILAGMEVARIPDLSQPNHDLLGIGGTGVMPDPRSSRPPSRSELRWEDQLHLSDTGTGPGDTLSVNNASRPGSNPPGERFARRSKEGKRKREDSNPRGPIRAGLQMRERTCIRCQALHLHCSPGTPCDECRRILGTARIWKYGCFKANLTEIDTHRTGALSFPGGVPTDQKWATGQNKTLILYNAGFLDHPEDPSLRPQFKIVCRRFSEQRGDQLSKSWIRDGQRVNYHLPAYAMPKSKRNQTAKNMTSMMIDKREKLFDELGIDQHKIISRILAEAKRRSKECPMLQKALGITVLTRLLSKSFNIRGSETLGIEEVQDPQSPYKGRIPLPPLLDAQIDDILMDKADKIKKSVLSELKAMMTSGVKRRDWYMVFLTTLVLLSNLEYIYQNQCRQRERYGPNPKSSRMMESWVHSAKVLKAYFHDIPGSDVPLKKNLTEEDREAAGLDDAGLRFLEELRARMDKQGKRPPRRRGRYPRLTINDC